MAWRDSRKNRSRLFLFISSIIVGIAALVAIYSFGDNLKRDIDNQAATLIGADLSVSDNRPFSKETLHLIDSLKGLDARYSEENSFASMILFKKNQGTRLVQIRALSGDFPYYGELETTPAGAATEFRKGKSALVDKTLMLQFNAQPGDSIQVGNLTFQIAGILNKAPGQTGFASTVAPAVFIPLQYVSATGLLQKGSRINYTVYYKFPKDVDVNAMVKKLDPKFEKQELNYDTIQTRKENTGKSFSDLTDFLALVGFIALLLGCIGVASSVHIYMREKLTTVAVLRCMGVSSRQAFLIYLIQILGIGFIGSVTGALLGTIIQQILPVVLKDFLPVEISSAISWLAVGQGILLGMLISVLFALLPLLSVRKISPLNTLRLLGEEKGGWKDWARWLVFLLIALFVIGFATLQLDGWIQTLAFAAGLFIAFAVLYAIAMLLVWMVRRFFPTSWSYLWRQGLSNLYRPNNQTAILLVSIGLGTAFISLLFFVQSMLIGRVTMAAGKNQPNMILFDIQSSQKAAIASLTRSEGLPVIQEVPVITMRLQSINDQTAADIKKDKKTTLSVKPFGREFRVTFRDTLGDTEKLSAGKWMGSVAGPRDTARISVEQKYAESNHWHVGDRLMFNVQGLMVPTVIGSLRTVEWNRVQTNFLVIFPKGVLEDAPQFHVLVTRVQDNRQSAAFQQKIVQQFPNVSVIDLALILNVLDEILDKIGFVIRFMAAFSILTGLVVLIASVMISKYQRMQESVLLRTLGASRKQVFAITALEYVFLGALSALTGILLALAGGWALARFSFDTPFRPALSVIGFIFLSITALTVLIGLLNSRGVLNRPPLEVLRKEV
ncbi:FtsX-like permease family protein [Pedobacter sp. HMF7647]|uniref:FtsX-like permease family protein n=2 Tax=Hufsiella arboris TaxID=2695275 RepID=A0A7K1YAW6_9SPHI|nr:FtsX-like permease family protein [Hufsiella arboris]